MVPQASLLKTPGVYVGTLTGTWREKEVFLLKETPPLILKLCHQHASISLMAYCPKAYGVLEECESVADGECLILSGTNGGGMPWKCCLRVYYYCGYM